MPSIGPERIIFVGGAPRSGTTLTHALICTSRSVCRYHPEVSFFRAFPAAYQRGLAAWREHTSAFFNDAEGFRLHMRRVADLSLDHVWMRTGHDPVLSVKDPLLTPYFPALHELYPRLGYFVTVWRHPYDVVRSRQEVHEKSATGRAFGLPQVEAIAREYLHIYQVMLGTDFSGRHFGFRYEDWWSNADSTTPPRK